MQRKNSLRLPGANYNAEGIYFITPCVQDKLELFGCVVAGDEISMDRGGAEQCSARTEGARMELSAYGQIAHKYWMAIPEFYIGVRIDAFVIMPNHVHGLIVLDAGFPVGAEHCSAQSGSNTRHYGLISKIIKSYKEAVVKEIRLKFHDYDFHWQRSFHDRIVRNEHELDVYRQYIKDNPLRWWQKYHSK